MPFRLSPNGAAQHVAALALAGASLVAAGAASSIFLSSTHDAWTAISVPGPAGPGDGILLVAGLCGTLLSLWLGLGLTLSALSALPGALGLACKRLAGRIAPAAVRKVVAFVLGSTLTAALVPGTAAAGIGHEMPPPAVVAAAGHPLSSLADAAPDASFRLISDPLHLRDFEDAAPGPVWSPDGLAPHARLAWRTGPTPAREEIVVHRGDTLWSIAARHLGPSADGADIDAEWHRWHVENRDVIGDDPHLILPGQRLRPPPRPQDGS